MNNRNSSSLVRFVDLSNLARFIVFPVAQYQFALPIEQVLRVMSYPATPHNPLTELGLIQISRRIIKVIDLQRHLYPEPASLPEPRSILVIIRSFQGDLYGIPVSQSPDLLEVSPAQIQALPQPTVHSSIPEIISSALVMPSQVTAPAIFLLDLKRVLAGKP